MVRRQNKVFRGYHGFRHVASGWDRDRHLVELEELKGSDCHVASRVDSVIFLSFHPLVELLDFMEKSSFLHGIAAYVVFMSHREDFVGGFPEELFEQSDASPVLFESAFTLGIADVIEERFGGHFHFGFTHSFSHTPFYFFTGDDPS